MVMAFMDSPPSTPETAVLVVHHTILYHTMVHHIVSGRCHVNRLPDYLRPQSLLTAAHCNGTPLSSWLLFLFSRWFPHTLGSHQQLCHHKLGISIHNPLQAGVGARLGFQNENAFIALELSSFSLQYLSNV